MILGKFESGARPGTWSNRQLNFQCKSIIKEYKNKVKTENFKVFFIYTLHCCIFLLTQAIILRFFLKNKKFACHVIEIIDRRNFCLYLQFLYLTQIIQEQNV
jgi:hypothetical protein